MSDLMETTCCAKPNIARLAYRPELTNNVCLHCKEHWYGMNGEVTRYSKAEWDELMETAA